MPDINEQKGSLQHFRRRLQEQQKQSRPTIDTLNAEQQKRLAKLFCVLEKLKRGENVQNRQLQTWLDENEYAQIETEWQEQLELRDELRNKPSELKRYEDKLREAVFAHNRAEWLSSKGKHTTAKRFYNKSESLCEAALEILQEIVHTDAHMQIWFDRNLDFDVGSGIAANIFSLPRLVTSRSIERQREDCRVVKKIDVKISVVERAINDIGK